MQGLLKISSLIDKINTKVGQVVKWFILAAVLVATVNAIIRKVFNVSSNAWLELQWYLFGAVFMLCAAYTFLNNEHIRIDVVTSNFRKRTRDWIDVFGHIFFLMPFALIMIWHGFPFFARSYASGGWSEAHTFFILHISLLFSGLFILNSTWSYVKKSDSEISKLMPMVTILALILLTSELEKVLLAAAIIKNGWESSMNAGGLTVWPAKLLVPLGFVLLLAQGVSELIKRVAILRGELEDHADHVGHAAAAEAEAARLLKAAEEIGVVGIHKQQ